MPPTACCSYLAPCAALLAVPALAGGLGNTAPFVDSVTISPVPTPAGAKATIRCAAHDTDYEVVSMRVTVLAGTLPGGGTSELVPIAAATSVVGSIAWNTPAPGIHDVTCTVTDSGGFFGGALSASRTTTIAVGRPPRAGWRSGRVRADRRRTAMVPW